MGERHRVRASRHVVGGEPPFEQAAEPARGKHRGFAVHRLEGCLSVCGQHCTCDGAVAFDEVDERSPGQDLHAEPFKLAPHRLLVALAHDAAPEPVLPIEAGDELPLVGAVGAHEAHARRLELVDGGGDVPHEHRDELRQRRSASHFEDRADEVVLVVGRFGPHEPQAPCARIEARAREQRARACDGRPRSRARRVQGGRGAGDAASDHEHVECPRRFELHALLLP